MVCLLAATFSQGLIILSYRLNRQYIASTLCINRNNPAAHCNGHCYLKKQLTNDDQPVNPLNNAGKTKLDVQLFFAEGDAFAFARFNDASTFNPSNTAFKQQEVLHTFFKPPCL